MRIIDAGAVIDALNTFADTENGNKRFIRGINTAKEIIENAPTIEPAQGEWVMDTDPEDGDCRCSHCKMCIDALHKRNHKTLKTLGYELHTFYNFCPHCGAKMKGDKPADKLLPCIKCNSRPSRRVYADREYYYEVVCVPCKFVASGETQEAADRAWNKLNEGDKA